MAWWMNRGRLRAPADPDGGAGGGGTGEGDGPKYVTEEQLSNVVNAAVSTHVGRAIKKTVGEIVPTIVEQVTAALKPDPGDGGEGGGDGAGGDVGGGDGKPDPAMTAMKRQMTQVSNKLEVERTARIAAETRHSQAGLRSAVLKGLGIHKITGERQDAAIASLYHNERVKVAEDGSHLFVDTNGDELPLGEGIKGWAGSDSAKLYLPPREIKGSGDSGGGRVPDLKVKDDNLKSAYSTAVACVEAGVLDR